MRTHLTIGWILGLCACAGNGLGNGGGSGGEDAEPGEAPSDARPMSDPGEPGPPGCGLDHAAFCDPFDQPSERRGRAGELDATRWSLGRIEPELGTRYVIGPATVADCRPDVPAQVLPPQDTLVCAPTSAIASSHLLVAVAAQNYGINSYRIRQPFDFAGRTGTITFDVDATILNPGWGWPSIEITDEPMNGPSFSMIPGAGNYEGGVIPKNGVEVQLNGGGACPESMRARVESIHEYRDYVDHVTNMVWGENCIPAERHHLNRFQIRLSQDRIEVWATPASADGVTFAAPTMVASAALELSFTRGWVHISVHNHASLKYSDQTVDSWVVRWDNVGFDGPVVGGFAETEAPAPLEDAADGVATAYFVEDRDDTSITAVTIQGVTGVRDADLARLSFDMQYLQNAFGDADISTYGLRYRLNAGAWHDEPLRMAERALLADGVVLDGDMAGEQNAIMQGIIGHVIDVPVGELVEGDNRLEIATVNMPVHGYRAVLSNVDLVLEDLTP